MGKFVLGTSSLSLSLSTHFNQSCPKQATTHSTMHTNAIHFFLVAPSSLLLLLLLVMGAQGQDPTTYIKPYPALTYSTSTRS
jgi:hypothetical protein